MCIIVAKPAGKEVSEETLRNCFEHNSDGAGFSYPEDGKVAIQKGFFTFEKFYEAYQQHDKKAMVIHFRIRTHGATDADNCHPFRITPNLTFAHNGVISKVANKAVNKESDTVLFNQMFLSPFIQTYGKRILKDDKFIEMVESYIGNSKLAFLNQKGEITIFNRNLGNESDGVWFSNMSWKPRTPVYNTGHHSGQYSNWRGNQGYQAALPAPAAKPHRRWNYETNQWDDVSTDNNVVVLGGKSKSKPATSSESMKAGDCMILTKDHSATNWQFVAGDHVEVHAWGQQAGTIWVNPMGVGGDKVPVVQVPAWILRVPTIREANTLVDYYGGCDFMGTQEYDNHVPGSEEETEQQELFSHVGNT